MAAPPAVAGQQRQASTPPRPLPCPPPPPPTHPPTQTHTALPARALAPLLQQATPSPAVFTAAHKRNLKAPCLRYPPPPPPGGPRAARATLLLLAVHGYFFKQGLCIRHPGCIFFPGCGTRTLATLARQLLWNTSSALGPASCQNPPCLGRSFFGAAASGVLLGLCSSWPGAPGVLAPSVPCGCMCCATGCTASPATS